LLKRTCIQGKIREKEKTLKSFSREVVLQWLLDRLEEAVWLENQDEEVVVSNEEAGKILKDPIVLEKIRSHTRQENQRKEETLSAFPVELNRERIWVTTQGFQPPTASKETIWYAYLARSSELEDHSAGQFLSLLSHELKTPLISIVAFLQMLKEGDLDLNDSTNQVLLESAWKNTHKLQRIVSDLVGLRDTFLDSQDWTIQEYDPRRLFQVAANEAADNLGLSLDQRFQMLIPPDLPTGLGDRDGTERAWSAFFESASKLARPGQPIQVQLRSENHENRMILFGDFSFQLRPQVSPEILKTPEILFKPFVHPEEGDVHIREGEGVGVDLALADRIIRNGGGQCRCTLSEQMMKLSFELPLGGDEEDLRRILQRRMSQKLHGHRDLSVVLVSLNRGPEESGAVSEALKRALFRSSDAVFPVSGQKQAESIVVMDDCLLSDRLKVEKRLRVELQQAFLEEKDVQVRVGGSTFPEEGSESALLLDLARDRLT
jgi:signal transduction histidine kinase